MFTNTVFFSVFLKQRHTVPEQHQVSHGISCEGWLLLGYQHHNLYYERRSCERYDDVY